MKQSKAEIRSQLNTDMLAFMLNGGSVQEIPAKNVKTKVICRGKAARANTAMGNEPTFRISSMYGR